MMRKGRKKATRIDQERLLKTYDAPKAIYQYFARNPDSTAKQCVLNLGFTPSRVYNNIKKLCDADLLSMRVEEHNGHTTAYYSAVEVLTSPMQDNSVQSTMTHKKEDGNTLCGFFQYKSFNKTLEESRELADPEPLWKKFWYEGEICCLFGDSGTGKSTLAVQIAKEIAEKKKVLYYDFELTDKQVEMRYKAPNGEPFEFPDNMIRPDVNFDRLELYGYETQLIDGIEKDASVMGVDTLIIDNISWLCSNVEDGDLAGKLMMQLIRMKKRRNWSILVLAHTPKRETFKPISPNDLAGSKRVLNFLDSAFAIGSSAWGVDIRYIKQIKVRYGRIIHGADNVISAEIRKDGAFLFFDEIGNAKETDHFKKRTFTPKQDEDVNTEPKADMMARELFTKLLSGGKSMTNGELEQLSGLKHRTFNNRLKTAKKMGIISLNKETSRYSLNST
jgi:KaiC/GvpD/RAD55 family RecA-like ATPase